ncbi:multi-sensor signal transduction histidine kinase [Candidatus Magnetobacterium bavaricum]|uniref:histidine kinase n=1 Tax=Candidatus Magnetobacterium bavaricum TaxID=29290 RepID=A0A0F3GZ37_9BACT|nr:multi-sensor signal transduction histidine kinase [Candidatus Magnetobacterium bavaricum]
MEHGMSIDTLKVFDNVPMGMFVLQRDLTVLFWNRCLEDWTNIPRESIVGTNICDHYSHFRQARYLSRIKPLFDGGPPTIFSSALHKHIIPSVQYSGQLRIQHTTVTAMPQQDGQGFYALFAIHDVTDLTIRVQEYKALRDEALEEIRTRKKAQQQLQDFNRNLEAIVASEIEKRRLHQDLLVQQSKMAAMGEMIAAIAHQWRTPLTGLGLLFDDVRDAYEYGELDQPYLDRVIDESTQLISFMSKTIDDFRRFYRPDKEKERFNARDAVQETLSLFSAQLRDNNIAVEIICPNCDAGLLCIYGYPNEFKQVILNTINNARDAIIERIEKKALPKDHGKIRIELTPQDGIVTVSVNDNGGGIKEDIIGMVFEPYFTTKSAQKGTGIGLYMSRVIIENNMNGHIRAENIDDGCAFIIELKRCKAPDTEEQLVY